MTVEAPPRSRTRVRRTRVALVIVLVVALLAAASWLSIVLLQRLTEGPADYSGSGGSSVVIEVSPGDTASDIGATLAEANVVASSEAFVSAAAADDRSLGIQPGFYELPQRVSAEVALKRLLDPASRVETSVTIPEGLRVSQTVDRLVAETDIPRRDFEEILENPQSLRLPPYAEGDPEGFLFPATYTFNPDADAEAMLRAMVDRFKQAARDVRLLGEAAASGYTPREVVVVASLVQAEVAERDFGKAARVVRNRLDVDMMLQFDSTVNFALESDDLTLENDQLGVDSPYNTYVNTGLPPGPINNPGEAALAAVLSAPDGDWLYFVAVAPGSDETKFTADYDEFLQFKDDFYAAVNE